MIAAAHPGWEPRWCNFAFRPFLLNKELDGQAPTSKIKHLEQKVGKPLSEMRSVSQLIETGRKYGLSFRFEPGDLASGTEDSHRLLQLVATIGGPTAALAYRREVMRRFNEEGAALSDRDTLFAGVEAAGVDRETAEAVLDGPAYAMEVTWMDGEARKGGINMVPHYRFYTPDGTHSVTGYYEEWHFLDAFYKTFPSEAVEKWDHAALAAEEAVSALDSLNALRRAARHGGGEPSPEEFASAKSRVQAATSAYQEMFLSEATVAN